MPTGGWCPKGRRAEDGAIDNRYPLKETPHTDYAERTEWNVRDSDGTLIISPKPLSGGTKLTAEFAKRHARPCLVVDPSCETDALDQVIGWLDREQIKTLNVAGPRASKTPDHYAVAYEFLRALLAG